MKIVSSMKIVGARIGISDLDSGFVRSASLLREMYPAQVCHANMPFVRSASLLREYARPTLMPTNRPNLWRPHNFHAKKKF